MRRRSGTEGAALLTTVVGTTDPLDPRDRRLACDMQGTENCWRRHRPDRAKGNHHRRRITPTSCRHPDPVARVRGSGALKDVREAVEGVGESSFGDAEANAEVGRHAEAVTRGDENPGGGRDGT